MNDNNNMIKCPFCNDKFLKSTLNDHMGFEHYDQLQRTVKRAKAGIFIAVSFVVFACAAAVGMLW